MRDYEKMEGYTELKGYDNIIQTFAVTYALVTLSKGCDASVTFSVDEIYERVNEQSLKFKVSKEQVEKILSLFKDLAGNKFTFKLDSEKDNPFWASCPAKGWRLWF